MRTENQVYQKLKEYHADDGTSSILRSDNGTEYTKEKVRNIGTNNKTGKKLQFPIPLNQIVSPNDTTEL